MSKARFMCHAPECDGKLRAIIHGTMSDPAFTLECNHVRSKAAPTLKPGRVSLENLNTDIGLAAFPPIVEAGL
jgi:hypothetical protein